MFAVELDGFGLTMLIVQVMSHRYFRADIGEWEVTIVATVMTLGFAVEGLEVRINEENSLELIELHIYYK